MHYVQVFRLCGALPLWANLTPKCQTCLFNGGRKPTLTLGEHANCSWIIQFQLSPLKVFNLSCFLAHFVSDSAFHSQCLYVVTCKEFHGSGLLLSPAICPQSHRWTGPHPTAEASVSDALVKASSVLTGTCHTNLFKCYYSNLVCLTEIPVWLLHDCVHN